MAESILSQLRARGEAFLTEVSNAILSNPRFHEVLKKSVEVKEEVDKRVTEGLRNLNVATRKDLARLEQRLESLEAELERRQRPAASTTRRRTKKSSPHV